MLRRFIASTSSSSTTNQKITANNVTTTPLLRTATCFFSKLQNVTEYHTISDRFIEDSSILADNLLDKFSVIEDANVQDGVLEIKAPPTGTFVLNKQAPLLQVWYSSPISGPHHYDYDMDTKRWLSDKDKHDLQEKMERELGKVVGEVVKFESAAHIRVFINK